MLFRSKKDNSIYTDEEINVLTKIFFDYIKSIKKCTYLNDIYDKLCIYNNRQFNIPINRECVDTMFYFNNGLLDNIEPTNLLDYVIDNKSYKSIENEILNFLDYFVISNSSIMYSSRKFDFVNPQRLNRFNIPYKIYRFKPYELKSNKYNIIKPNNADVFIHMNYDNEKRYMEKSHVDNGNCNLEPDRSEEHTSELQSH